MDLCTNTKDMYKEKQIAIDLLTFEHHHLTSKDDWSTDIAQPIINFISGELVNEHKGSLQKKNRKIYDIVSKGG